MRKGGRDGVLAKLMFSNKILNVLMPRSQYTEYTSRKAQPQKKTLMCRPYFIPSSLLLNGSKEMDLIHRGSGEGTHLHSRLDPLFLYPPITHTLSLSFSLSCSVLCSTSAISRERVTPGPSQESQRAAQSKKIAKKFAHRESAFTVFHPN